MARSTYVYVVFGPVADGIAAGFTVKHEMMSWLERNPGVYKIYRLSDGGHRPPVDVTEDILGI